ncbi:MAG: hypothetical protein OXC99_01785 [Chloroflexi bacterium]|nr:hypothetical protein [Chloroflexota bacterium]
MLLGDVVFWVGIVLLAGGLLWRVRLRRDDEAVGGRLAGRAPYLLMLAGVVLAIAGLVLTGTL